ncbi:hypothetical_protein [Leishmania major strain Friedlin]|nr:hypothetical_protein [Leishmania major strain Friedlin]
MPTSTRRKSHSSESPRDDCAAILRDGLEPHPYGLHPHPAPLETPSAYSSTLTSRCRASKVQRDSRGVCRPYAGTLGSLHHGASEAQPRPAPHSLCIMALSDHRPALCVRAHKNKSKMARRACRAAEPSVLGPLRIIVVVDPPSVQHNRKPARHHAICTHHTTLLVSSAGKDVMRATLRFAPCKVVRGTLEHARQRGEHSPTQGAHALVRGTATSSSSPLHART